MRRRAAPRHLSEQMGYSSKESPGLWRSGVSKSPSGLTCVKRKTVSAVPRMTKTEIKTLVTYWAQSAQEDWAAYEALRRARRYAQSLFFLHLTLEKLLKAIIVKQSNVHAPMTHSLPYLLGKTSLECPEQYLVHLGDISRFNMASRYPDEKLAFYQSVDKAKSLHWHKIGSELKKWLENSLNANSTH